MEYKRNDGGLKINREALARFTEFSNLRLCVYTPYAHENSNQSLKHYISGNTATRAGLRHYSELDSSGSVTKLTTHVSLKGKFGETNLH